MNIYNLNKKEIITSIFIIFCLVGYVFFPANGYFQYKAVVVIFLVLLPIIYNKFILKRDNLFKKVTIGDWKNNLKWLLIGLGVALLIIATLFEYTDLQKHYLLSPDVKNDFWQFLLYEFTGIAVTVAIYELFFRGFVMFYFSPFFKKWAIAIQFLFFIGMVALLGLPYWFSVTYLIFTPIAGWIAYKSESLLYSFLGQLFFIIIVDASFIALTVK